MRAEIIVTPRTGVFDPEGEAVRRSINGLGLVSAHLARVGKFIELELETEDEEEARKQLDAICRDLLSNPVVEDYQLIFPAPERLRPAGVPVHDDEDGKKLKTKDTKKKLKSVRKKHKKKKK